MVPSCLMGSDIRKALKRALKRLGYIDTYHMDTWVTHLDHNSFWLAATKAKWENGPPVPRSEWDRVLGDYQAVTDNPCTAFAQELVTLYPDARVVLTNKDPEKFWASFNMMMTTLQNAPWWWRIMRTLSVFRAENERMEIHDRIHRHNFDGDFMDEKKVKQGFKRQYDEVRKLVPKDRLLEYRIEEGWEPLCRFLGEAVPEDDFPRGNSKEDFKGGVMLVHRVRGVIWIVQHAFLVGVVILILKLLHTYAFPNRRLMW